MTVKVACVVFDCSDALIVGRFWSAAIDRPLDPQGSSEFASIGFMDAEPRRDADRLSAVPAYLDPRPGAEPKTDLDRNGRSVTSDASRGVNLRAPGAPAMRSITTNTRVIFFAYRGARGARGRAGSVAR